MDRAHPRSAPQPAVLPFVASLDDGSLDLARIGLPAATVAQVARLGLPVLPGFVVTPAGVTALAAGGADSARLLLLIHVRIRELTGLGYRKVSIGPSRIGPAAEPSAPAVLAIDDRSGIVRTVLGGPSRSHPSGGTSLLVQARPTIVARGVGLGVSPWTGLGRPVIFSGDVITGAERRRIARVCQRARGAFGTPQDVDWAVDVDGRVWLSGSRPLLCWPDLAAKRDRESPAGRGSDDLPDDAS